ncbi:hypothetical protein CYLTODRAFT_418395 [Cylindrobasidium torrendii FP15055 ss-10]|uniref:Uncharacterized protein n=1 Tax=Cylindrobasidium torrendii FP15055 ss-10 TaxID=1314674 RepID=A0A0D7BNG5_9AGAR|nr:hypothetical protein CYLTODRAFT_418395 [Cylindrobasidium torrendii FP15055 ss-10]
MHHDLQYAKQPPVGKWASVGRSDELLSSVSISNLPTSFTDKRRSVLGIIWIISKVADLFF